MSRYMYVVFGSFKYGKAFGGLVGGYETGMLVRGRISTFQCSLHNVTSMCALLYLLDCAHLLHVQYTIYMYWMCTFTCMYLDNLYSHTSIRGTHGSIKYGPIQVLCFNRELRIADHYLRPLCSLNCIFNSHGELQITLF